MTTDNTYNGWTNYATWRIALEIFDGFDVEHPPLDTQGLSEALKDYAEEIVSDYGQIQGLALDYALAFMDDVNWYEIAENLLDNLEND